jgi:serine phosphatase RsbU (regulator of sigma subunit)
MAVDYDRARFPDEVRRHAGETNARLALWVPIVWQDRLLGVLGIDEPGEQRVLTKREVELVEAICTQAGAALANAGSYEMQYRIATTLQESFRHPLPESRDLEVGLTEVAAFEPALVGGDFWDVMELGDGRVMVLIGDVAGKGIAAAGLTETVRSTMRAFASVDPVPAYILRKTNELLLREPEEAYVTALVVIVDPKTRHVCLGSAGHPGPVLLGRSACAVIEPRYGPPLGSFKTEYTTTERVLSPGDSLVLYTDGVTEARSGGKLFGEQRLLQAACALRGASAQETADGIREAALSFASRLTDDLEVLVLRGRS